MTAPAEPTLLVSRPDPRVLLLTINRPDKRNALTNAMLQSLTDELTAAADAGTGCVVITGSPPAFCSGGDLRDLLAGDDENYREYCELYRSVARAIKRLPCPTIAAVNGAAVAGGFELMCLADLRVAAHGAKIFMGDPDHGLPSTSGLSWLLPRLVGVGRARWIAYLGRPMTGDEALAIGLVEQTHPTDDVVPEALAIAAAIASKPGLGIELTRRLIDDSLDQTHEQTMEAELEAQVVAWAHPAVRAAINDFLARRR